MATDSQLTIPAVAASDPAAFEIVRVWIANKAPHVSLRTAVWKDPAAWGILLADLARHVASSYQQEEGLDRAKTLQRIKDAINAELRLPTDEPTGALRS